MGITRSERRTSVVPRRCKRNSVELREVVAQFHILAQGRLAVDETRAEGRAADQAPQAILHVLGQRAAATEYLEATRLAEARDVEADVDIAVPRHACIRGDAEFSATVRQRRHGRKLLG